MHDPLLHKVRGKSVQASDYGRESAVRHVCSLANVSEDVADDFYEKVKDEMSRSKHIAVNLEPEALAEFLQTSRFPQVFSDRRKQIERAVGASSPVTFAFLSKTKRGNTRLAPCSVVLSGVEEHAVVVAGDAGRLRNPARGDYVADPSYVLYDWEHASDAMASASILALGPHELSGGLSQAMAHILDDTKVFGPCHALVLGSVSPQNIKSILVPDDETADEVRKLLVSIKRLAPVEADSSKVIVRMPFLERESRENEDTHEEWDYQPMWIRVGDKVATKPMASNPQLLGRVIQIANGKPVVQWTNGDRSIFDLQEALMRLMPAPEASPMPDDAETYSLPGMDKGEVGLLLSSGVDPVNLYSVASTYAAPKTATVNESKFVEAMSDVGVDGEFVDGFAEDEDMVYVPWRWFEANLPFGNRLVVDLEGSSPKIGVGAVPEYVLLPQFTDVPIE